MGDQIIQAAEEFRSQSIYSIDQLNYDSLRAIVKTMNDMRVSPEKFQDRCLHKHLVIDFETPSTHTILSTQLAWKKLGGCVTVLNGGSIAAMRQKGENMYDHFHTIADLGVDCVAVRCQKEFLPHELAIRYPHVSWINCGDGGNEHPTQGLLDFVTILHNLDISIHTLDTFRGKKIAFVGDIKYSRTVHSLSRILELFDCNLYFVAHDDLHDDQEYIEFTGEYNRYSLSELPTVLKEVDIVYATRNQIEYYSEALLVKYNQGEFDYCITPEMLEGVSTKVMHPFPRYNEISPLVDSLPNCAYFGINGQLAMGVKLRMALFSLINQQPTHS